VYQHYHDRRPPWFKVHAQILDDLDWRGLTDSQKGQLVSLWALASRLHSDLKSDPRLPNDPAYLSAVTGCRFTEQSIQTLINARFLVPCEQDASNCLSSASPRARGPAHSVSASVSKKISSNGGGVEGVEIPDCLGTAAFRSAWSEWLASRTEKRKPVTKRAAGMQLKKLATVGPAVAVAAIEQAIANDWQGLFPDKIAPHRPAKDGHRIGPDGLPITATYEDL
jgi:hypothetical protein